MVSETALDSSGRLSEEIRLNPCSCGRWSQSLHMATLFGKEIKVLILVLVEDGLREVLK